MNADQRFQLWLTLLSLGLCGIGAVVWWFARKVLEMHKEYVSKEDWHDDIEQLRKERERDHNENSRKLDKIDAAVSTGMTGIHSRIDALFDQRSQR